MKVEALRLVVHTMFSAANLAAKGLLLTWRHGYDNHLKGTRNDRNHLCSIRVIASAFQRRARSKLISYLHCWRLAMQLEMWEHSKQAMVTEKLKDDAQLRILLDREKGRLIDALQTTSRSCCMGGIWILVYNITLTQGRMTMLFTQELMMAGGCDLGWHSSWVGGHST